ncbi:7388_t:CDS:2, partial [Acaulospora colombiana]
TPPSSPMSLHIDELEDFDPIPVNRSVKFDNYNDSPPSSTASLSTLPDAFSESNLLSQNRINSLPSISIGNNSSNEFRRNNRGSGVSRDVLDLLSDSISVNTSSDRKENDSVSDDLIQLHDRDFESTDGYLNFNEINFSNTNKPQPPQISLQKSKSIEIERDIFNIEAEDILTSPSVVLQTTIVSQKTHQGLKADEQHQIQIPGLQQTYISQRTQKSPQINQQNQAQKELIKIDVAHCQFKYRGTSPHSLNSRFPGDLAFLYKSRDNYEGGGEISICIERMSIEALIPINQLCGFKITGGGKINLKFNRNFQVKFLRHLGGYPYLLEPTILEEDPTGIFDNLLSVVLASYGSVELSKLSAIEKNIETEWFHKCKVCNEVDRVDGQKENLKTRFDLKSSKLNLKYKNRNGELIDLKDEDSWELAKNEAYGKNLVRLEIHIW